MLSSDKNVATIVELVAELKTYFELKKDYLKVDLVEKVVKLVTALAVAVTLLIITVAVLFYFSMAAVYWMAPFVGQAAAFAIMALFFLLLLVLHVPALASTTSLTCAITATDDLRLRPLELNQRDVVSVLDLVYEGLFTVDDDYAPQPELL